MSDNFKEYLKHLKDLKLLYDEAYKLSINTTGRKCTIKEYYASNIFVKIVLTVRAMIILLPNSPLLKAKDTNKEIWDISSICVLCRSLIETYLVFYYLTIDEIPKEERDFRYVLWEYHANSERLKMLELIKSNSPEITNIRLEKAKTKGDLEKNSFFKSIERKLEKGERVKIRKGEKGIFLTNSKIAEKAGINREYYRATYKYLSQYVHTYPFSISQIAKFNTGEEESLNIIDTTVQYATLYTGLSIRDFITLFPDMKGSIENRSWKLISDWEYVAKKI